MGRGDFIELTEAVAAAAPGDRLLVYPGVYEGGLVLDKPLEIIGQGERDSITIQAQGENVVLFQASMGRITNLSLRQLGGGKWYGVDIERGRLHLAGCDISSRSLACVAIHGSADPEVNGNRIHDGKQSGVFVHGDGRGRIEDNDISGNAYSGIEVKEGGNPTVRSNRINRNGFEGVWVWDGGSGTFEENDLRGNERGPWDIEESAGEVQRSGNIEE